MTTVLMPAGPPAELEARLRKLDFPCRSFAVEHVAELTHASAEVVYLIPPQVRATAAWPKLRVQLAQASRLYIATTGHPATAEVARCLRDGAHDVLSTDDTDTRWREAIVDAAANQKLWLQLYGGRPLTADDVLIGCSEALQHLRQTIDRLGPTDVCVLIQGESGVGKERVASALHKAGRGGPYVALNCAAIPKDLLEAELFGVEKGAFTGANKSRAGLAEQANGGTLFLDEVGEMELAVQPKLLRFLETRRARRVGGEAEYSVNARVISATNRNLAADLADRRFRPDLYYRLAELILQVPPLCTRPEDIPELALTFVKKANERFGKNFETLEPALIEKFQRYTWPGNVRELKSTIDRLVLLFDGPILREPWWDLPEPRRGESASSSAGLATPPAALPTGGPTATAGPGPLSHFLPSGTLLNTKQKLDLARRLLEESGNNYTWVAGQLGINSSTLWRWRKLGKV